jgi:dTDP-4-dehydrorhamnose reductase
MTKPTWMITGANGFLGTNATAYLADKATTIGITRDKHDLTNPATLVEEITNTKPDYLLHAAAIASHQLCEEQPDLANAINAEATRVLARACENAGTKMIYISTDSVFSGQPTAHRPAGNYTEQDPTDTNTVYGESKLQGELHAQTETNPLIVRTNFFGWSPTGHGSILEFFVNELGAKRNINGFTNFTTTSLYVQTLMDYIYQLKYHAGIFHVTSRDAITKYEFGIKVAERFNLDESLITPTELDTSKDISLNTEKLAGELNLMVDTQDQGLEDASRSNRVPGATDLPH